MQVFGTFSYCLIVPLQDFAFAEYENADSALRALRLLHNMDMGTGKLSLKCDTKTQTTLQEHHRVKIQKVFYPARVPWHRCSHCLTRLQASGVISSAPVLNGTSLPPKTESASAPVRCSSSCLQDLRLMLPLR